MSLSISEVEEFLSGFEEQPIYTDMSEDDDAKATRSKLLWPTHSEENIRQQIKAYHKWTKTFEEGLRNFVAQGLNRRQHFEKLGIVLAARPACLHTVVHSVTK